ncbi:SusC/RagA family TonB-linked outer membrane protein [Fibrella forsythiae]|uniref:SusC/RagA family TonB-linked outer membrane protein n=1 Tax=Fibrella forsythiae TaxID=2817061 RepID=A0ABS3JRD4_9BACT|nr:SusC/RagA family TonB-linked outer membrane protein [Fibrella forsythiae]MBO0952557.1 SusC/RagA family TonB-linked outer membrane protein [Fibrella forsythiae]
MNINLPKTLGLQLLIALSMLFTLPAMAQTGLKGAILDDRTGAPLSGVPVKVKYTKTVAVTDQKGEFDLPIDTRKSVVIQVNTIGYEPVGLPVQSAAFLTIRLKQSVTALQEVVISSGYTLQPKSEASGAVSSISAKQLSNRPAVSFDQLLGGQATGIDIIQPSNILNNTPVMRVRGINTITSGLFPLVVVDGVTVFVGSIGGLVGNNPLSDINPNDIQSIDVLKDASAAAIYGSRAANGVMVITTKKGSRTGKPKVNYDTWVSRSTPYNLPKLLSAEDYMTIKNEALTNAGRTAGYFPSYNPDGSLINTNWYDVAFRPGISHNHNLSISGGNEATTYYFSAGYTNQNAYIKNNTFERMAARLNIDHQVGKTVKVGANITVSNGKNVGTNTGAIPSNSMASSSYNTEYITNEPLARMTYVLPPNVPVYRPDGSYSIQNGISVGYGANVPGTVGTINAYNLAMVQALDLNSSENNTVIGNVFGEWELLPNLTFRTSYGLNNLGVTNKSFFNPVHGGGASSNGIARNTETRLYRTDWVNTFLYTKTINERHNLSVLLGQEVIKTTTDGWGAAQSNVTDPSYTNFQGGYVNISPYGNVYSQNALLSYFGNVNYDYRKRYLLSVNLRRDGLSALADGNKWGNFGGGSVGWAISEEGFYKNAGLSRWVDNLKIRASYGVVGNSEIGDYPAVGTYVSNTYGGVPTLAYAQAANPDLRWETSRKVDVGLNLSLLANRINVEFDYYRNQVDGLILKAPQALSAGLPGNYINANVGSLYNEGIELGVNALVTNYKDFKWNSSLNVSTLKNRVTSLVNDVFVPSVFGVQNMTRVGYSVGSIFAVPCVGVNPANGLMVFTNAAGRDVQYNHVGSPRWTYVSDGSAAPAIDNYQDGVMQGPSLPTIFGGFNNTFQYKNFDLTLLLTFVGGNKLYNGTRATNSDQRYFNNGEFIKDRWTTPGQITEIQKLYYGDNVSAGFSFAATSKVEDGSYIKLRTLSLGYHVPVKNTFLNGRVSSAYLYAQGGNLFTLTRYRGSDPEVSINGNSINSGKDQNVPPNAQVLTLGLNVGF